MGRVLFLFLLAAAVPAESPDPDVVRRLSSEAGRGDLADRIRAMESLVRLGLEHEAVRDAVGRLLKSHDRDTRLLALDAIPATREPEVVDAVARCQRHHAWQVRAAAAEALGRGRAKEAIEPLIVQLDRERQARARRAIADALHRITALGFGDYTEHWRSWWKDYGAAFVVPEHPPGAREAAAGGPRTASTFFGVPVEGGAVVFVVDRSASMMRVDGDERRTRFEIAVEEVLGAVDKLERGSKVNVVFFGTEVWAWRKGLASVGAATRAELASDLKELSPSGGTYLYDALERALEEEDVEAIYLLSDGEPSGGKVTGGVEILAAVRARNRLRRASIHCIAVGIDSWLLKQLALQNAGTYVRK